MAASPLKLTIEESDREDLEVPDALLDRVLAVYEQGRYITAFEMARAFAELSQWRGTRALVMASRLAGNLGAPRFAAHRALIAWRGARQDPDATYYAATAVFNGQGPLAAWRFLRRHADRVPMPAARKADLEAFRARVLGSLRDFERAAIAIAEAERLAPDSAWVQVEKSYALRAQDRYEESLAAAEKALRLQPNFRPAIQAAVVARSLAGRDTEAFALLRDGTERLEAASLWLQLAEMHQEREEFADALAAFGRYEACSPMMEEGIRGWLSGTRARAAHRAGRRTEAVDWARKAGDPYHERMAGLLEAAPADARRVQLKVDFIRQHHMTCAPACIAMLAAYWGESVDQAAIVRDICYDGTEDHKERRWALDHGFMVREGSLTWDTTRALIDAGIPFFLNTQETASAHLQIVIGYDPAARLLLIRDPYNKQIGEFQWDGMEERYRHNGPRIMTMIPHAKKELCAFVAAHALTDAALFDERYVLRQALAVHDRSKAQHALAELGKVAPDHWLTLNAHLEMARYDADAKSVLALTERLYELNTTNKRYLLVRLNTLREHAKATDRVALLRKVCEAPGADPVFLTQLADELRQDRRGQIEAEGLLLRAVRQRPGEGHNYWHLAELARNRRDFADAAALCRFAASLDDKNEHFAASYFSAARYAGDEESKAGLAYLERRFEALGERASGPSKTLFWAYEQLARGPEALDTLERALKMRPNDGDLLLYAAERFGMLGQADRADELVARAKGKVSAADYAEACAQRAEARGAKAEALTQWTEVGRLLPAYIHAHHRIASLTSSLHGRRAALDHLEKAVRSQPDNRYLRRAQVEWLRDQDTPELEAALLGLIEVTPADAWTRRELAMYYAGTKDLERAAKALADARPLDPESPGYFYTEGYVHKLAGRRAEAKTSFMRALELNVDSPYSLSQALSVAESHQERAELVRAFHRMLMAQTTLGEGVTFFYDQATSVLEPAETASLSEMLLGEHDHLVESWSIATRALIASDRHEEARTALERALVRFPLTTDLWMDMAALCHAEDDAPGEERALLKCLEANPAESEATRRLAQLYERSGELEKELQTMASALARNPKDQINLGYHADALWRKGDKAGARARLEEALAISARYDWGWHTLHLWNEACGEVARTRNFADELAAARPADAWLQVVVARLIPRDQLEERLAALGKALAIAPDLYEAHEIKMDALVGAGRADEAVEAFRTAALVHDQSVKLGNRLARTLLDHKEAERALGVLDTVLERSPVSFDAWRTRADACCETEKWDLYKDASRMLVQLEPRKAASHGYLGEAYEKIGERGPAKDAYAAALALMPEYDFAACRLFDLHFDDKELDAATAVVERFPQADAPSWFMLQRACRVHAAAGRDGELEEAFRRLCGAPAEEFGRVERTIEQLTEAGKGPAAEALLGGIATANDAHGAAVVLYAKKLAAAKSWVRAIDLLAVRTDDADSFSEAADAVLRAVIDAEDQKWFLAIVQRLREPLAAHVVTWSMTGYGYTHFGLHAESVAWLGNWEKHPDAEPWALANLTCSLRHTKRHADAARVAAHAVTLPADHATGGHKLWVVLETALAGDGARARALLNDVTPEEQKPHALLTAMAEATTFYWEDVAASPGRAFRLARERFARAAKEHKDLIESPYYETLFWRAFEGTARHDGLTARLLAWNARRRGALALFAVALVWGAVVITRFILRLAG